MSAIGMVFMWVFAFITFAIITWWPITNGRGAILKSLRATIVVFALLIGSVTYADESARDAGKKVGQGFKTIGEETGKAFVKGGKEVGQGFKEMGKEVGQEAKKTGRTTGEWFRDFGRKTGKAFTQMGKDIKGFFTRE